MIEMMQEIAEQCDGIASDLDARGLAALAGIWREKASQARQLVARRVDDRRTAHLADVRPAELPQHGRRRIIALKAPSFPCAIVLKALYEMHGGRDHAQPDKGTSAMPKVHFSKITTRRQLLKDRAVLLARNIVTLWNEYSDENSEESDMSMRDTFKQIVAELSGPTGVDVALIDPLRYFAKAFLDGENPHDFTFQEMTDEIGLGLEIVTGEKYERCK